MSANPIEHPRADAVLKQKAIASPEFGEQLYKWAKKGVEYARKQLAADGIVTSIRAVSQFRSWWLVRMDFSVADEFANSVTEVMRKEFPDSTPEKLTAFNQLLFTMRAANSGNSEEWREMEYLRLAKAKEERESAKLKLEVEKFWTATFNLIAKAAADAKTREMLASNISNAEKISKLRQTYFADIDALEKSGAVQIPKL